MRFVAAPLLLLPWLAFARAQSGPRLPESQTATSTFRDDSLRLSYAYPSSYRDATTMAAIAFQAALSGNATVARDAKCLALPFSRMGPAGDPFGLILLVHAQAACLGKKFTASSVTELAEGEAQGLAASGAKTTFGPPVSFSLATRPAASVQGTFTLPTGQPMQAMIVCVLDQPDIACWQFLSFSAERLGTMASFPVTFDGSPAAPLAPPTSASQAQSK